MGQTYKIKTTKKIRKRKKKNGNSKGTLKRK